MPTPLLFQNDRIPAGLKQGRLRLIAFITLAGFALSYFYFTLRLSPQGGFLNLASDRFNDFFNMLRISADPYARAIVIGNSFPFLQRVYWAFSLLPLWAARWLWLLTFAGFGLTALYRGFKTGDRTGDALNTLAVFCFSYPVLFAIDRGNFETYTFMCVYLFATAFAAGKRNLAAVFLGIAMAMKPFPAAFLGLLLAEKEFDCAARSVATAVGLSLACYASYPGGLFENFARHTLILQLYHYGYVYGYGGVVYSHSLFGAIKALLGAPTLPYELWWLVRAWGLAALALAGSLVWFAGRRRTELRFWEKTALFVCAMNLLPYSSGDYKLLHLLTPLIFFANEPDAGPFDRWYAVVFGLLLIPKGFIMRAGINEGVIINPLLMLCMAGLIIYSRRAQAPERG
ncbi:MAG: glycosyltransferase family 87 protein [Elusimicrobiaceae bacterium]|nr:glycosyltransferase family 87 protein [Elusimicrobiaceae bacterium]